MHIQVPSSVTRRRDESDVRCWLLGLLVDAAHKKREEGGCRYNPYIEVVTNVRHDIMRYLALDHIDCIDDTEGEKNRILAE
jgi:hypothetical protein